MTEQSLTLTWTSFFLKYPGHLFLTLRLPRASTPEEADRHTRKALYEIAKHYRAKVSAIGVRVFTRDKNSRHAHMLIETDSEAFKQLDNRPNAEGQRLALPISRYRRTILDHVDALDISPVDDINRIAGYLAQNMAEHGQDAELIRINDRRQRLLQAT